MSAHGSLVNACIQLINARGGFAWKNQSGRLPVGQRYVYVGKAGLPDVIGVMPKVCAFIKTYPHVHHEPIGRLIAVEVKVGKDTLKRHQEAMHAELRERGALVIVARSIVDVEKALA